jgi:murein DD-endopeptidase MepM/ murein hydrolase activator NlpD
MVKKQKTLSEWLRQRFLIIVRDEENFSVKTSYRLSIAGLFGVFLLLFMLIFSLSLLVTQQLVPAVFGKKDKDFEQVMQLLTISDAIDSLGTELQRRDVYIANLRRLFLGTDIGLDEETIQSLLPGSQGNIRIEPNPNYLELDSLFRFEMESGGMELSLLPPAIRESELSEMFFFSPVKGIISAPFDISAAHFGVDLVANRNEPIMAIADGTVVLASWTQDSGYVIAIQHAGNLLSVYKHNSILLKKVGSFVSSGEAIAIIGNSGELTDGPHLHFEVWHNGTPIDPEQIISF